MRVAGAGNIVLMIMVMGVNGNRLRSLLAEQRQIFWMLTDRLGQTGAAQMLIQAQYLVGLRHDQVQIVRHQQYRTLQLIAQFTDQLVHAYLTTHINAGGRLIEHQQIRLAERGARQQHAFQFPFGQRSHLPMT